MTCKKLTEAAKPMYTEADFAWDEKAMIAEYKAAVLDYMNGASMDDALKIIKAMLKSVGDTIVMGKGRVRESKIARTAKLKLHEEFKLYENLWEAAGSSTYTVLADVGWSTTKSPNLSLDDAIESTKHSLLAEQGYVYITWIDEQTGDEVFEYDERLRSIKTGISKAKTELNKVLNTLDDPRKRDKDISVH
jgi:hypothetical protein